MAFTLIREERITHTDSGLQLEDDLYIKLDAAFDELVAELGRGGQLSALIHIQLREAYASSGRGDPATLKTIAHAASCKERQAQRIAKSLLEKCLIAEAGMSPHTGEKFYRPIGYAWFGNNRTKSRVSSMTPPNAANDTPGVKCHPPDTVVVVDQVNLSKEILEKKQQTTNTAARKILQECGIFGKPLERLSESVDEPTARAWLEWIETAPSYLHNPVGVIVNALLADPEAIPPKPRVTGETVKRAPSIRGKFAPKDAGDD